MSPELNCHGCKNNVNEKVRDRSVGIYLNGDSVRKSIPLAESCRQNGDIVSRPLPPPKTEDVPRLIAAASNRATRSIVLSLEFYAN